MSYFRTYEEIFNNLQLKKIASKLGKEFESFYIQLKELFLYNINITKMSSQYPKSLHNLLEKLTYKRNFEQHEPFCATNLVKNIKCYRCFTCERLVDSKQPAYICQMCFESADHKEHNFRYIISYEQGFGKFQFCYCGDEKVMDKRFFCTRHNGETQKTQMTHKESAIHQRFINEMQFLLYIFFRLRGTSQGLQDQHTKKDIFGVKVLEKIISYAGKDYLSQITVAKIFETKYFFDYPYVPEHQHKKSLLHIMLRCQNYKEFMEKLCMDLLIPLYFVPRVRNIVIKELFQYFSSTQTYITAQSPIKDVRNQFFKATKEIKYVARRGRLAPLVLNYSFTNFCQKVQALMELFKSYKIILNSNSCDEIITFLVQNMEITQLCVFTSPKDEKIHHKQLMCIQSSYFQILLILLKKINILYFKNRLLLKIIRQTYAYLKSKKQTLSRSVQRTFALAFFSYFNCQFQNLREKDRQQLVDMLEQRDSQSLQANIRKLVIKSLNFSKSDNTKYRHASIKQIQRLGYSKIMLCVDQIYQRILLNLLLKCQTPNTPIHFSPIIIFIQQREKVINKLDELHHQNKMQKLLEIIDTMFEQIFSMIISFITISQTQFAQVIVKDYMGFSSSDIFEVFRLLVSLNPKKEPKEFKKDAFNFTKNSLALNNFIKSQLNILRQKVQSGFKPLNIFNLSFDTIFLFVQTIGHYDFLYNLKSSDPKRTEISTFIFTEQSVQKILSVGQMLLNSFNLLCELNQKQTKNLVFFAFQTLLNLYVQTGEQKVGRLIETIIDLKILEGSEFQYYKEIKDLYLNTEKKKMLENCPKSITKEGKETTQRKSKILQQKKNKILSMQSRCLKKFTPTQPQSDSNKQTNQANQICILCKQGQYYSKLFYPSYCRYSNLMSKVIGEQNFPIMLITTCGHLIHQTCFRKAQASSDSCPLCKAKSNMILPISRNPSLSQAQEFVETIRSFEHEVNKNSSFLKHAIYNFHDLNNVISRFIASLVYQIFGYSLYYVKFFVQKIIPILKISLKYLKIYGTDNQILFQMQGHFRRSQNNYQLYSYIYKTIIYYLGDELDQKQLTNKEIISSLKVSSTYHQMDVIKHKNLIKLIFDYVFDKNAHLLSYLSEFNAKLYKPQIKSLYKLPLDLQELNRQIGKCPQCRKNTSKIIICLLCSKRICRQCKNQLKWHLKYHLSTTAFVAVETGQCFYYTQDKIYSKQLYVNLVGEKIPSSTTFPEKNQYLLSQQSKNLTVEYLLNDFVPSAIAQQEESLQSEESADEREQDECYVQ